MQVVVREIRIVTGRLGNGRIFIDLYPLLSLHFSCLRSFFIWRIRCPRINMCDLFNQVRTLISALAHLQSNNLSRHRFDCDRKDETKITEENSICDRSVGNWGSDQKLKEEEETGGPELLPPHRKIYFLKQGEDPAFAPYSSPAKPSQVLFPPAPRLSSVSLAQIVSSSNRIKHSLDTKALFMASRSHTFCSTP